MRIGDDDGSAIVEVTFLGVLLLIPLAYALLAAFEVQRAAYALTAASRDAGRAFVQAGSGADAFPLSDAAVRVVVEGHGMSPDAVALDVRCSRDTCLTPGATVTLVTSTRVPLPWLPSFVDGPASIAISAEHAVVVDRFREDRP
jgi:hypothetical protein